MTLLFWYLIVISFLIILDLVERIGSGEFLLSRKQFQPFGFPFFILAVYLFPLLIVMEMAVPGFLNDLRPFIFKKGQFTPLPGRFRRSFGVSRTDI